MAIKISGTTVIDDSRILQNISSLKEKFSISNTAITGTVQFDVRSGSIQHYVNTPGANWVLNIRGDSSTSLASLIGVGESVTAVSSVTIGNTSYYNTGITIDGTNNGVFLKWLGGTSAYGNTNTSDIYSYTVLRTGPTLSSVAITGTAGQISFATTSGTVAVGQSIFITGTLGGTGSITGYSSSGTLYYIIATNGTSTATISTTVAGSGVTTTAGTPTGLTYNPTYTVLAARSSYA